MQNFDAILNLLFIVIAVFIETMLASYFTFLKKKILLEGTFIALIYLTILYIFVSIFNIEFVIAGGFSGEWLKQSVIGLYIACVFVFILALIYYEFKALFKKERSIKKALINIICLTVIFVVGLMCTLLIHAWYFSD